MLEILIAFALLALVSWNGIRVQFGTKKNDPTQALLSFEIYPARRFFRR